MSCEDCNNLTNGTCCHDGPKMLSRQNDELAAEDARYDIGFAHKELLIKQERRKNEKRA